MFARPRRRSPAPLRALVFVAALFAVGLTGCGGTDSDGASPDPFDATALAGTATTVDGEVFDLATLADSDLVIWFWAPW